MTRREQLENAVSLLALEIGQPLELNTQNPGDDRRYWVTRGAGYYYSPRLPFGELDRMIRFALMVAKDAKEVAA